MKTSWKYLCNTSWRRFEDILKTFWRRLEDVLKRVEDVLKTYGQEGLVLKTSSKDGRLRQASLSWSRRLEDALKTSSEDKDIRRLEDLFKASSSRRMFAGVYVLTLAYGLYQGLKCIFLVINLVRWTHIYFRDYDISTSSTPRLWKNPCLSNSIPYLEHLFLSMSRFLVKLTIPNKQFSCIAWLLMLTFLFISWTM